MKCMSLSRGRGRPQKQLIEPSYEGYPVDGTEVEKKWWLKMKATEQWRYNILSSNQATEYHEHERHRVREYQMRKAQQKQSTAVGAPPCSSPTPEMVKE